MPPIPDLPHSSRRARANAQRGAVLIVALMLMAIIALMLGSYLSLSLNSTRQAQRSFYGIAA